MGRYRGIPSRTSEIFSILVRDMFSFTVFVCLCEAEVDNKNIVPRLFSSTNKKIVRFNVTVDDTLFVHFFNASNHLDANLEHCLEVKLTLACLK